MIVAPRLPSRVLVQLLGVTAMLLAAPGMEPRAVLSGLALAATLAACRERRIHALQLAAAIATALSPTGLAALPLALGTSLRAGRLRFLPLAALAGVAAHYWVGGWTTTGSVSTLYDLALAVPQTGALIAAAAIGLAAAVAAQASGGRSSALLPAVTLLPFLPLQPLALVAPAILLGAVPMLGTARPSAANDTAPSPRRQLAA